MLIGHSRPIINSVIIRMLENPKKPKQGFFFKRENTKFSYLISNS